MRKIILVMILISLIIIPLVLAIEHKVYYDMNMMNNTIYNITSVNATTINASNITGSLNCLDIIGGTDTDFCDDIVGAGGTSTWIDGGTYLAPDSNYAINVWLNGTNAYLMTYRINASDWSNATLTQAQIIDLNIANTSYILHTEFNTTNETYVSWEYLNMTNITYMAYEYWNSTNNTYDAYNNSIQWNASYLFGYPVTGGIGSGILFAETNKIHCGCINVTDEGGLDVSYPNMIVRVAELDGTIKHCNIVEDTVTVTDNQHSVYYIDNACNIQSTTFAAYFAQDNNPSDYARLFDVFATDGDIEMVKGAALIMLTDRKMKWSSVKCGAESHLSVCNGIGVTEATFPYFNQTSGQFMYINSIMTSKAVDSEINETHLVFHTGGTWTHNTDTGINLSYCDDGTDIVVCPDNKYRRYIIYSMGQGMNTQIHQLVPLTTDDTYVTLGKCLNIVDSPISYILPENENGIAVIHHIYCGRRDDTSWSGGWIDLRKGVAGYGASIDTSTFFTWNDWNVTNTSYVDWNHFNITNETYVSWSYLNQTNITYMTFADWNSTNSTYDTLIGAGGGIPSAVNLTAGTYDGVIINGTLISYKAANQICYEEWDGHMCTVDEIILFEQLYDSGITVTAWAIEGAPGYTANANDCNGYQSNSGTQLASFYDFNITTGGMAWLTNCANSKKLACCS